MDCWLRCATASFVFVFKVHDPLPRKFLLWSLQNRRTWVSGWPSVQPPAWESFWPWSTRTESLSPSLWLTITQAPMNGETWALSSQICSCALFTSGAEAAIFLRAVHLSDGRWRHHRQRPCPAVWRREPRSARDYLRKPNPAAGGRAVRTQRWRRGSHRPPVPVQHLYRWPSWWAMEYECSDETFAEMARLLNSVIFKPSVFYIYLCQTFLWCPHWCRPPTAAAWTSTLTACR